MNHEHIVSDLEIVCAILDKICAMYGEQDDIAYARKLLRGDIVSLTTEKSRCDAIANGVINSTTGNPDVDATITATNKKEPEEDVLPCGRKRSEHSQCPHLSKNGACTAKVLTTFPPQYIMCPARGSGFIMCSEA